MSRRNRGSTCALAQMMSERYDAGSRSLVSLEHLRTLSDWLTKTADIYAFDSQDRGKSAASAARITTPGEHAEDLYCSYKRAHAVVSTFIQGTLPRWASDQSR